MSPGLCWLGENNGGWGNPAAADGEHPEADFCDLDRISMEELEQMMRADDPLAVQVILLSLPLHLPLPLP